MRTVYPAPKIFLENLFPRHTYESIRKKVRQLNLPPQWHRWRSEEEEILKNLYPEAKRKEVMKALPRRTWGAIRARAEKLEIKRCKVPYWLDYEKSKLVTGDITDFELGFIVGLFEGEGYVSLHHPKKGNRSPSASIGISNTNIELLKKAQSIIGGGIYYNSNKGKKTCYHLTVQRHNAVLFFLERLLPHLIEKREKAVKVIEHIKLKAISPRCSN